MPRYIYIILILLGLLLLSCKPKPRNNPLDPSIEGRTLDVPSIFNNIQNAIDNAIDGDTVLVANGTYIGEGNKNISFMGKAITVRSKNGADSTIINCEQSGNGFLFENNEDSLSVLDGFTIKNGQRDNGGGILSINSSPTIQNCIIDSCTSFDGGGIKLENSYAKLINCTFSNNSSSAGAHTGGGISIDKFSDVQILNCTFISNTASDGAGIYISQYSLVHIYSSNFLNNKGDDGINKGSTGGGIDVQDSEAHIEESYISGNNGMGINSRGSQIRLISSVIKNNTRANLYSYNSTININNSLFTDTLGVYNIRTYVNDIINITNSTLVQTGLQDEANLKFQSPNVNIINSIIWSNDSLRQPIDLDADSISITYSNVLGGWPGIGNVTGDPAFVSDTDFHLTELSPGVGRASPESSTAFDLEGNARPNSGESLPDIGCYESSFGNSETAAVTRLLVPDKYATIQSAIGAAVSGDTVLIADGHYFENLIIENQSIVLASYFLLDNDTTHIANTIIDGDQKDRVIYISNEIEDTTSIFCGFTITNGLGADGGGIYLYNSNPKMYNLVISNNQANADQNHNYGGGIFLRESNPEMTFITISGNMATESGGGMYLSQNSNPLMSDIIILLNEAEQGNGGGLSIDNSNPIIKNSTISNNIASEWSGGGIYVGNGSSPIMIDLIISDNTSQNGGGIAIYDYVTESNPMMTNVIITNNISNVGGGLYLYGCSSLIMTDITISGNTSDNAGGGMYLSNSNPIMIDITISNNTTLGDGGGVYLYSASSPLITGATITKNKAKDDGGGMYLKKDCSPIMENILVSDNSVEDKGGGIFLYLNSNPEIKNILISNNAANDGGGIYVLGSSPKIENVTINNNIAYDFGGGIFVNNYSQPSIIINSILWNNIPDGILTDNEMISDSLSITYSNAQGGFIGEGNINIDPLFTDPENGDYHLQKTSPCIDAGNPDSEYNDTDGSRNNMGAYGGPGGNW